MTTPRIEEIVEEFKQTWDWTVKDDIGKDVRCVHPEIADDMKDWLKDTLTTLSIKIHTDAIKELEGRKKNPTNELRESVATIHNQALDEAITYHKEEISKLNNKTDV